MNTLNFLTAYEPKNQIHQWGNRNVAHLLRAESSLDEAVCIVVRSYPILSYTPCGAWIDVFGKKKFVNLKGQKQWASVTEKEALYSLKRRKQRQIPIVRGQLQTAEATLAYLLELEKV